MPASGTLRSLLAGPGRAESWTWWGADAAVKRSDVLESECFEGATALPHRASVLLAIPDQATAAWALARLDGVARRIVLCPNDVNPRHWPQIVKDAEIDVVIVGEAESPVQPLGLPVLRAASRPLPAFLPPGDRPSEWVLMTSGTSGAPKLVQHCLASLTAAIPHGRADAVWGTFYDTRRYGGLQILLRAAMGGGSMIFSDPEQPIGVDLARFGRLGVTHLSGTPSHWRRALMSGCADAIAPRYVRLSGEIADQPVIDALRATYPDASVSHAYASTEAGVAFNVTDGRAGFPAAWLDATRDATGVALRLEEGALGVRSAGTAARYLGAAAPDLRDPEGFVDTGDLVERDGDRLHFKGRRSGIINVGGLKVHPEEVEAVLNGHPFVQMSLVRPRRNPILGALVVADVVLREPPAHPARLAADIKAWCRARLSEHKAPVVVSFVASLGVLPSGKLARHDA